MKLRLFMMPPFLYPHALILFENLSIYPVKKNYGVSSKENPDEKRQCLIDALEKRGAVFLFLVNLGEEIDYCQNPKEKKPLAHQEPDSSQIQQYAVNGIIGERAALVKASSAYKIQMYARQDIDARYS
ncbi:MAG: hypothetical protein JSV96_12315 [Candidatus Aminicenantes bacterium]|nr:MAG: hypothetical protein JSV96_12315 [Candidatus Aminicenantes bacterium]